jgi:membrane-bound lytic murein transglycosylase B
MLAIILSGGLVAHTPQSPTAEVMTFQAGNLTGNGSLFAAAPPHGQVLGESLDSNADTRSKRLEKYLRSYRSPMAAHAGTFITVADRYDLDWRLLPAIAGVESGFGKRIPRGSFNAWGWGIPTGAKSGLGFDSWDHGIETVARGLRVKYFNAGFTTLRAIESRYTPPSAAQASHPWASGVAKFMGELDRVR